MRMTTGGVSTLVQEQMISVTRLAVCFRIRTFSSELVPARMYCCGGQTSTLTADIKQRNIGSPLTTELNGLPQFTAVFTTW